MTSDGRLQFKRPYIKGLCGRLGPNCLHYPMDYCYRIPTHRSTVSSVSVCVCVCVPEFIHILYKFERETVCLSSLSLPYGLCAMFFLVGMYMVGLIGLAWVSLSALSQFSKVQVSTS